jgi:signal transduction histidine kinase
MLINKYKQIWEKLNRLERLSDCLSPASWLFVVIGSVSALSIIFHPSVYEMLIMLAIDSVAHLINAKTEQRFFFKINFDLKKYFHNLDTIRFEDLSDQEKKNLIYVLCKFPLRRAVFCYFWAFVKTIPAMLVMLLYWEHNMSWVNRLMLLIAVQSIQFWFFSCTVFIESHDLLSRKIADLHKKYDLTNVFQDLNVSYSRSEILFHEWVGYAFCVLLILAAHWSIIYVDTDQSHAMLAIKISTVSLISLVLLSRIWFLNRIFLIKGLETLFKQMENTSYKKYSDVIPLHSAAILAKFDLTFNLLNRRLKASELELSALAFVEAEKSRYRALGEMSGLIAHDLSGPLHVARFCVNQIEEDPQILRNDRRYLEQLSINLDQAIGLTTSIQARIKNSNSNSKQVSILEAHDHVVRLLKIQFNIKEFSDINIKFDQALSSIHVKLQRVDLIHILDNLYRNSFKNLIQNKIEYPEINIKLSCLSNHRAEIEISDNGTGLSRERYEDLTTFHFVKNDAGLQQEGLGLRLTRRLVESNQGQLVLIEKGRIGTTFSLSLPLFEIKKEDSSCAAAETLLTV